MGPSVSTLPDGRRFPNASLVWGWRTICVFLGFATRVKMGVVGVVRGLVLDLGGDEGSFDAFFGGGPCVGLDVANDECGLVFSHGLFAVGHDVVEPAEVNVRPGEGAGVLRGVED